jgi:hypothetical protein
MASGQSGPSPVVYSTASFTESFLILPAGRNPPWFTNRQQFAQRVIPGAALAAAAVDAIQDKVGACQLTEVDNIAVHQRSLPAFSTAREPLYENSSDSRPSAFRCSGLSVIT